MLNGYFNHRRILRFDLSSNKKKYSGQTVIIKRFYISDPYALLGIRRGASEAEIRKAYVKKVKENHPDLNKNNPRAQENFIRIKKAYEQIKAGGKPDPHHFRRSAHQDMRQKSHDPNRHRTYNYSYHYEQEARNGARRKRQSYNYYETTWDDIKTEEHIRSEVGKKIKPYMEYLLIGSFVVIALVALMDKSRQRDKLDRLTRPANPRIVPYYSPELFRSYEPENIDEMKMRRERFYQEALRRSIPES